MSIQTVICKLWNFKTLTVDIPIYCANEYNSAEFRLQFPIFKCSRPIYFEFRIRKRAPKTGMCMAMRPKLQKSRSGIKSP